MKKDYAQRVQDMVAEAAKAAQAKASALALAGLPVTLYLYYLPATPTADGMLTMVNDDEKQPEGYQLATGEGLRGGVPYANYHGWIHSRVQRVPILAWEA